MKATIYTRSEMLGNIVKIEVNEVTHERKKFAQYASAVHVTFRKPRQRLMRGMTHGYRPSVLILEGWGHPNAQSDFHNERDTEGGCVVSESRYSSCDPRWQGDFDTMIDAYIATSGARVVADYRGVNTYEALPSSEKGAA